MERAGKPRNWRPRKDGTKQPKLFVRARKTSDQESRKKLLFASYRVLKAILIKYPDTTVTEKVNKNLQTIETSSPPLIPPCSRIRPWRRVRDVTAAAIPPLRPLFYNAGQNAEGMASHSAPAFRSAVGAAVGQRHWTHASAGVERAAPAVHLDGKNHFNKIEGRA